MTMIVDSAAGFRKELPLTARRTGWGLLVVGVLLCAAGYAADPREASFNNVIGFLFLASIAVGALFLIALEYLTGAFWSVPMRRVIEFLAGTTPLLPLLALPVLLVMPDVFPWAQVGAASHDAVLAGKQPYLNVSFFMIRVFAVCAVWILFMWLFTRFSQRQDGTREQKYTMYNGRLSAVFMPVFALTVTVIAIDWGMSLEPHWYSTIFGVYYFSGVVIAALAAATYCIVRFHEKGILPGLTPDHLYSLGALQFAFISFWAYIAFSQFMLIWYSNLPEETSWFLMRWRHGWQYVSVLLILMQFAVPYFVLLPQDAKTDPRRLKFMSLWLLAAHYLDLYWLVMPTYSERVAAGWMEIGFPVLCTGIVVTVLGAKMSRHNIVPVGDPKLARAWEFRL
jgi:hypothetical protein